MPSWRHPLPKVYFYFFVSQLLLKLVALDLILLFFKSTASFTFTSVAEALWSCSQCWPVFVAAHPAGGQREGNAHFQGHFLPWHTESGVWWQIPQHRQALHSPANPWTLNTGSHLSGNTNLRNPDTFLLYCLTHMGLFNDLDWKS